MTFKPAVWHPIAIVLGALNLVGAGFAAGSGEPWHATAHVGVALAFGAWAQRLRVRRSAGRGEPEARLDELEGELDTLRQELAETQERLDFAERMLAQGPEGRRLVPERNRL